MPQVAHFVKDTPQGPHVTLVAVSLSFKEFRGHVVRRADACVSKVLSIVEDAGDTKITDFDLSTLSHEYVLGFEVAMKDFTIVDMFDR